MRNHTDPPKLNSKPERIVLYTVPQSITLQQVLLQQGRPQQRLNELAIINGMELNTQVPAGTIIKLVRRG